MYNKIIKLRIGIILLLVVILFSKNMSQTITGTSTVKLNSPITAEFRKKQFNKALDSLFISVNTWLNSFYNNSFDLNNSVSKYFMNQFFTMSRGKIVETSSVSNSVWTLNLSISDHLLDLLITSYNTHYDSLALYFRNKANNAQQQNLNNELFLFSIKAMFYSMAHMGHPLEIQQGNNKIALQGYLRSLVQRILSKVNIDFNTPIISGRPASYPEKEIIIKVSLDTVPFGGFPLYAALPNGRKLLTLTTGSDGTASLSGLKIPFIAYGSFLHIRPDFAGLINTSLEFDIESFGIKLPNNCDQTLIFNIKKLSYSLTYSASSVNQIQIPEVFKSENSIQKFLSDSLPLKPVAGNKLADLIIKIKNQASSYTYDEREETVLKIETQVTINETKANGSSIENSGVIYEKVYDYNKKIPEGLFFWNSMNAMRKFVRKTFYKL